MDHDRDEEDEDERQMAEQLAELEGGEAEQEPADHGRKLSFDQAAAEQIRGERT